MTAAGCRGTAKELVTWNMVFQNNKIKKRGKQTLNHLVEHVQGITFTKTASEHSWSNNHRKP
jgi:hypothetical protein